MQWEKRENKWEGEKWKEGKKREGVRGVEDYRGNEMKFAESSAGVGTKNNGVS